MTSTDHKTAPGFFTTWRVAVRPFAYTASLFPVLLGVAVSSRLGFSVSWLRLAVTVVGVMGFHTAGNLLSDCFDYRRGLDREVHPRSGAIVRGWISPKQALRAGVVLFLVGSVCGIYLVHAAGWVVLLLGVLGAFLSVGYTCPPLSLKYRGLGDLCVFLSFGVLPLFGSFWVQAETFAWQPLLWSLPPSLLTVGILHANNWRDRRTDPARGCRTPASLLGEKGSAVYYCLLVVLPFVLLVGYVGLAHVPGVEFPAPAAVLLALFSVPLAIRLCHRAFAILKEGDRDSLADLDALTAQTHLAFNLLLLAGFVAGSFLSGAA